jgi:hypothetical protein
VSFKYKSRRFQPAAVKYSHIFLHFSMHTEDNMPLLTTYTDFLQRVDELGFLPFSHILDGLPSVSDETPGHIWHTGDRDTDPWQWKDRAAEEKKTAYGCILGGHKGFVSARMYAVFYTAYHPPLSMLDRWTAGEVNQTTWQLWRLFEEKSLLNTSDVRREMGVTQKSGGSRVDASLVELQKQYYLTMAGCRQKTGKDGKLYGWPATVFDRVQDWAPAEWLKGIRGGRADDAREVILDVGVAMSQGVSRDQLAKALDIR